MDEYDIEQEAIALIDEFSANVSGKSLILAIDHGADELAIRAVAAECLSKFIVAPTTDSFSVAFGQAIAFGAFLQHKGRFDIMKLRGTIQ